MRISESDLVKKLLRQILQAEPDELALMAENLLGVKAVFDHTEYCTWDIEPIPEFYSGAFDIEFGTKSTAPELLPPSPECTH